MDEVVAARVQAWAGTPLPEQVAAWRTEAERGRAGAVPFYDLTFSPVKSVTVLHTAFERAAHQAREAGDLAGARVWAGRVAQIDEAVAVANTTMLGWIADNAAYSRTGRHGARSATGRWVDTGGLVVAWFYQHTSRALDPQLHVHNAILNKVECPDGKWRALDSRCLTKAKQAAGTIADRVLEVELTRRLGVSWTMRADGIAREVDGVDQGVMDLFSARSRTLTARAAELIDAATERAGRVMTSLERDRLRRQATMATRRAKTHEGESRAELLDRWDAQLAGEVAGGLAATSGHFAVLLDVHEDHARTGQGPGGAGRGQGGGAVWSPALVLAQAVEACHTGTGPAGGDGRSTFGRSELIRQILLALPDDLGPITAADVPALAQSLAERALGDPDLVVQTSGHELGSEPGDSRLANGAAATIAPGSARWAGRGHVMAEIALLRAAGVRGRHHLDPDAVADWLSGPGADLSEAQAVVVAGLAATDAALAVLVGAAGTGKSFAAGALAQLWADTSGGGRVVGVATAQVAADVLAQDGVCVTANVAAFLAAQARLGDGGHPRAGDQGYRLGSRDVLLVDEASMLDTGALTRLREAVEAAGARMVLMGDPHQLGAVGAGGMMATTITAGGADTFTLSDVRRFHAGWEGPASLALRDTDPTDTGSVADVVGEYDRHGRVMTGGTEHAAIAAIARAAAADRLAGRSTLVVTASNAHAAQVSAAVRRHLVAAGVVQDGVGVVLGRDGCTAGVGDHVQARRIDRTLGLTNRRTYRVVHVREDGGLDVTDPSGATLVIPAAYAGADLALAYAISAHAAQGATVDVGHVLLTSGMGRAAAYVGLTRGRETNTAWAITTGTDPHTTTTAPGVLAAILGAPTDTAGLSATDAHRDDQAHLADAATLVALIEDETRIACRQRLERDLDDLVQPHPTAPTTTATVTPQPGTAASGTAQAQDGPGPDAGPAEAGAGSEAQEVHLLAPDKRADLHTDQGADYLSRLLRCHEHAGTDPTTLLRQAVTCGSMRKARSVGQVITGRIAETHALPVPTLGEAGDDLPHGPGAGWVVPAGTRPDRAAHLLDLHARLTHRQHVLGDQTLHDPPAWATTALGPPPPTTDQDGADLQEWVRRAGVIAAWREATGWDSPDVAIGRCPGTSAPEKRALWHHAYHAAGHPEDRRPEAVMSTGRLLVRAAAGAREQHHAPTYVDPHLRSASLTAARATTDANIARARGDHTRAGTHQTRADTAREAAARLEAVAAARAAWLTATLETREAAHAALVELDRRGITTTTGPGPDATTATDWLTNHPTPADPHDPDQTIALNTQTLTGPDPTDHLTERDLKDEQVDAEEVEDDGLILTIDQARAALVTATLDRLTALHRIHTTTEAPAGDDAPGDGQTKGEAATQSVEDQARARTIALNTAAHTYYRRRGPASWVPPYLRSRLGPAAEDPRFEAGHAPAGWTHLTDHLRATTGATDQALLAAGLARRARTGRLIDTFRDRLTIPLREAGGAIIGFVARRNPTHDHPSTGDAGPKYLNTPTSAVYTKSEHLFGLAEATPGPAADTGLPAGPGVGGPHDPTDPAPGAGAAARPVGVPVLVEGPLDAWAITAATGGAAFGVATLGTALSGAQADQLDPWSGEDRPGVVVATDPDPAGRKAARVAFAVLTERGHTPRAPGPLPADTPTTSQGPPGAGLDPADVLTNHGPAALTHTITAAGPLHHTLTTDHPHAGAEHPDDRHRALTHAATLVAALPPGDWPQAARDLTHHLDLDPTTVYTAVADAAHTTTTRLLTAAGLRPDDPVGPTPTEPQTPTADRATEVTNDPVPTSTSLLGTGPHALNVTDPQTTPEATAVAHPTTGGPGLAPDPLQDPAGPDDAGTDIRDSPPGLPTPPSHTATSGPAVTLATTLAAAEHTAHAAAAALADRTSHDTTEPPTTTEDDELWHRRQQQTPTHQAADRAAEAATP